MPPFDIAASGVPTTAPNKVGSMGEIQAGSVNDTASSLSPFGPGNNVAQKGLDNLNNEVRNFDFSDMKSQLQNVANDAQSFLAGLFNGASFSFQSGISSLRAVGSNTLPDKIWAPTSEPFSITQIE